MSTEGLLAGGYGGALVGSAFGRGTGKLATVGTSALIGSALGALAGSTIHVDTYSGVVNIQIKQKVKGVDYSHTDAILKNGSATTTTTSYSTKTAYQAYRTRIAVKATQTNMNLQQAIVVVENKLA